MTITTNPARDEYTASPGQTVFNYTFKIYASTDLNVYVTPEGQEANDSTDLTTDYVVDSGTIGDDAGGIITFNTPLADGDLVTIVSDIPTDRTTDYQVNGDFIPETVNNDFDRTVSLVKQVENLATRTVQFQESQQSASNITLPAPSPGDILVWNAGGSGFDNSDGSGIRGIDQAVIDAEAARDASEGFSQDSSNSAAESANSAAAAQSSEAATQLLYDDFSDRYYGPFPSDPSTAPSGDPSTAGDLYFNTATSVMREYTGAAWQDIATAGIADKSIEAIKLTDDAYVELKSGRKNYIINGNFNVVQRSGPFTAPANSGAYTADRWKLIESEAGGSTVNIINSGDQELVHLQATLSSGTSQAIVEQRIEDHQDFNGQDVVASFDLWGPSGGQVIVDLLYFDGTSSTFAAATFVDFTSTRARYSANFIAPPFTAKTATSFIALRFIGQAGQVVTINLDNVQLEKGTIATDFEYRPFAEELALCQGYTMLMEQYSVIGTGYAVSATTATFVIPLPTSMRVAPTFLGGSYIVFSGTASNSATITEISKIGTSVLIGVSTSGLVANAPCTLRCEAGNLILDAEL